MESSNRTFIIDALRDYRDVPNEGTSFWITTNSSWSKESILALDATCRSGVERFLSTARTFSKGLAYALMTTDGGVEVINHSPLPKDQPVATVVIGRHSHADSDAQAPALALRHLLLVQTAKAPHAVQIYDLHSDFGTTTANGDPVKAATAELPLVLVLGPYLLLVCQTPCHLQTTDFIERATRSPMFGKPVELMNERFSFEWEDLTGAQEDLQRFGKGVAGRHHTRQWSISAIVKPAPPSLVRRETLQPSDENLANGILIGCYSRCLWPSAKPDGETALSRVHALVFSAHGETYLANLASTNGVRHEKLGQLRYKHLEVGDEFWLSHEFRLTVSKSANPSALS